MSDDAGRVEWEPGYGPHGSVPMSRFLTAVALLVGMIFLAYALGVLSGVGFAVPLDQLRQNLENLGDDEAT